MERKKILLGIPTNRMFQPQAVMSMLNLLKSTQHDVTPMLADKGYTIAENRNYLGIQAIKGKYDFLFSIDDDMIFPPDTLDKLVAHDKDFIGVSAHSRTLPPMSMITMFNQEEISMADRLLGRQDIPKELFKCKAVGGAVTLAKTSLFEKLEKPWFSNEVHETGFNKLGEDYWFCRQIERAGIDIWVDPTIPIGHVGTYVY